MSQDDFQTSSNCFGDHRVFSKIIEKSSGFLEHVSGIFIINEIGVTTIKKTMPITIGDTIVPNKIPNLNQSLFNGVKTLEFKSPKIKKIIEIAKDQTLNTPPSING